MNDDKPNLPFDAPERVAARERAAELREEQDYSAFIKGIQAVMTSGFGIAAGLRTLRQVVLHGGHLLDLGTAVVSLILIGGGIWLWNTRKSDSDL